MKFILSHKKESSSRQSRAGMAVLQSSQKVPSSFYASALLSLAWGLPSSTSQDSCWSSSHHHHRKERFREKEKSKGQRGLFPVKRAPLKTCPYYYEPPLSFKQSWGCSLLPAHNAAPNKIQGRRGEGRVDIHEYGSTVVKIVK